MKPVATKVKPVATKHSYLARTFAGTSCSKERLQPARIDSNASGHAKRARAELSRRRGVLICRGGPPWLPLDRAADRGKLGGHGGPPLQFLFRLELNPDGLAFAVIVSHVVVY